MNFLQIFVFSAGIAVSIHASGQDSPRFIEELIARYEAASEESSAAEIWRYTYRGESVFYVPLSRTSCCDRLSVLYDAEGEVICRPDGGFSGEGDGKCPGFVALPSKGVLLWGGAEQEEPPGSPAAESQ